jgi:hypothetical protein
MPRRHRYSTTGAVLADAVDSFQPLLLLRYIVLLMLHMQTVLDQVV